LYFGKQNEVVAAVGMICAAYLLGVLMRILQVEWVDELSAMFIRRFGKGARNRDGSFRPYAEERFPYIGHIGLICKTHLSREASRFHGSTWAPRLQAGGRKHNKPFFNFCKSLVHHTDWGAAGEIHADESLSRYIAGMFYSLLASLLLMGLLVVVLLAENSTDAIWLPVVLMAAYTLFVLVILKQFRFIRIKEAEAVFAACLSKKEELERLLV
jgi:hypothetical protein